jgi:hypothetical protein
VRPRNAAAQRQHRIGIDRQNPVEARAQFAPGVGGVPTIVKKLDFKFTLTMAAYDLSKLPRLIGAAA